jgi:3-oxoacyl-[acyl-carrier protein] reductase
LTGMLDGRVAIVTGAARGIGLATAQLLSEHGASILLADLDGDALAVASAQVADGGGEVATFAADLTKGDAPDRMVAAAIDAFGKLDIVVNNAGYSLDAPIHKMSDDWYQRMLDIHLVVPFRVLRAAAPFLREPAKAERADGVEVFRKVVNVSSSTGTMGNAGQANYAAGKAGIVGVTKTLAKEWGGFKVNVNAVAFSWIETRMIAAKDETNVMEIDGEQVRLGVPEQLRGLAGSMIPLGRPGTPREAAGGVLFLCSPWSDFVTGQVLTVSGGAFGGMSS